MDIFSKPHMQFYTLYHDHRHIESEREMAYVVSTQQLE